MLIFGEAVLENCPKEVAGVLNTALDVRGNGNMRQFRQHLYDEIVETADLLAVPPSPEAERFRAAAIELLLSSFGVISASLIKTLPQGDWTVRTRVHFVLPPGVRVNDDATKKLVIHYLACSMVRGFLPGLLHLYSRHHWTGFECAVDEQAALDCCHGLATRTAKRYCLAKASPRAGRLAIANAAPGALPLPAGHQPVPIEGDSASANTPRGGGDKNAEPTGPDENEQRRVDMKEFWSRPVLWVLLLLRILFDPLRVLIQEKLWVGCHDWEVRERGKVAAALNENRDPTNIRDYRVLIAAENRLEQKTLEKAQYHCSGPQPFERLLDRCNGALTVGARALGWRINSRILCALEDLLMKRHRGFPWTTYRSFRDREAAAQVQRAESCPGGFVDDWTLQLKTRLPNLADLTSKRCRSIILIVMMLATICVTFIESNHAIIRRLIKALCAQTHLRSFEHLDRDWILTVFRRLRNRAAIHDACEDRCQSLLPPKRKRTDLVVRLHGDTAPQPQRKKIRLCGGTWRTHVREQTLGVKGKRMPCTKSGLSESYWKKMADPAERKRLQLVGRAATKAGKSLPRSKSSFGLRSHDLARLRMLDWQRAMASNSNILAKEVAALAEVSRSQTSGCGFDVALRIARTVQRTKRQLHLQSRKQTLLELRKFSKCKGLAALAAWKQAELHNLDVMAVPSEIGHMVWISPTTKKAVDNVIAHVAWLSKRRQGVNVHPHAMDQCWSQVHRTLSEAEVPPVNEKKAQPRKCMEAGMHICVGHGRVLDRMEASLNTNVLKPFSQIGSPGRALLKGGSCLCGFWRHAGMIQRRT